MHILAKSVCVIGCSLVLVNQGVAQGGGITREALLSAPTPRTEQGHPDLNGLWIGGVPGAPNFSSTGPGGAFYLQGNQGEDPDVVGSSFAVRDGNFFWLEIDQEIFIKSDRENMPLYRPEYWEQVRWNEEFGYERPADPGFGCQENGIVKRGAPDEIIQLADRIVLLYRGAPPAIRQIPLNRPLPTEDEYEGLYILGRSVGHWDGDTLVVETVDFPYDMIWYSTRGWPQSPGTKITERFTRTGNLLRVEMTVDDPAFIEPWEVRPMEVRLNPNPNALLPQTTPCVELDAGFLTGERFGERFR